MLWCSGRDWRRRGIVGGMLLGLAGGLLVAVASGADSRLSAASGMSVGAVAGSFVHPEVKSWIRFSSLVLLAGLLVFGWMD